MPTENNFKKTSKTFFEKKDFFKMGGAVVITLFAVYLFNIFSISVPLVRPNNANRISTYDMRNFYNQYPDADRITFVDTTNGNHRAVKLEGFPIATGDLEDIIHNNKYIDPSDPYESKIKPDKILFYLGQDGELTADDNQKYKNIKLIAVGVTGTTLMVPTDDAGMRDKDKSSIYDKAMPCPGRGCPTKPPLLPPQATLPPPTGN